MVALLRDRLSSSRLVATRRKPRILTRSPRRRPFPSFRHLFTTLHRVSLRFSLSFGRDFVTVTLRDQNRYTRNWNTGLRMFVHGGRLYLRPREPFVRPVERAFHSSTRRIGTPRTPSYVSRPRDEDKMRSLCCLWV